MIIEMPYLVGSSGNQIDISAQSELGLAGKLSDPPNDCAVFRTVLGLTLPLSPSTLTTNILTLATVAINDKEISKADRTKYRRVKSTGGP